ncbi:unnamed protein product [Caenorhabditis nigoni]
MIREAVKADPRKKATLREINCFVRKTFEMPATFTKECVRRKVQANVYWWERGCICTRRKLLLTDQCKNCGSQRWHQCRPSFRQIQNRKAIQTYWLGARTMNPHLFTKRASEDHQNVPTRLQESFCRRRKKQTELDKTNQDMSLLPVDNSKPHTRTHWPDLLFSCILS